MKNLEDCLQQYRCRQWTVEVIDAINDKVGEYNRSPDKKCLVAAVIAFDVIAQRVVTISSISVRKQVIGREPYRDGKRTRLNLTGMVALTPREAQADRKHNISVLSGDSRSADSGHSDNGCSRSDAWELAMTDAYDTDPEQGLRDILKKTKHHFTYLPEPPPS